MLQPIMNWIDTMWNSPTYAPGYGVAWDGHKPTPLSSSPFEPKQAYLNGRFKLDVVMLDSSTIVVRTPDRPIHNADVEWMFGNPLPKYKSSDPFIPGQLRLVRCRVEAWPNWEPDEFTRDYEDFMKRARGEL